jgi:hypothetical protein
MRSIFAGGDCSTNLGRALRVLALLALSSLSGCFTMQLWDNPPLAPADRVLSAGLDDSHLLLVEIAFTNGERGVFTYELAGVQLPGTLTPDNLANREVLVRTNVVELPVAMKQPRGHELRFPAGASLHLAVDRSRRLVVTTRDLARESEPDKYVPNEVELVAIPNQGLDWSAPKNWGRAFLTLPAVALDIVTSPFQIGWYIYMLCTGQVCG